MIKIVEDMIEKTKDKQEIKQMREILEKYIEGGERNRGIRKRNIKGLTKFSLTRKYSKK